MLRMRSTALTVSVVTGLSLAGCLEPLSEDKAGYSRNLLPSDAEIASVSEDPSFTRRVDMNDGITGTTVARKSGFAVGLPVKYWELGAGRGSATPAYSLARCDDEGKPLPDGVLDHPMLFDAVPGDADYSQFWAINYVCVTPAYTGQRIINLAALSDAYELGLALEPAAPLAFRHVPMIMEGVTFEEASGDVPAVRGAYCRSYQFTSADFGASAEIDPSIVTNNKQIAIGYVYDLNRPGSTKVERVVFSSAAFNADGTRSAKYAPAWTIVNVTITADADIESFTQESDIATVNMDRTFTKASAAVVSVTASMNRSTRAVQF
jgi:hypothetical protein